MTEPVPSTPDGIGPRFRPTLEAWESVRRSLARLRSSGLVHRFPWASLEAELEDSGEGLRLFGYGSLMNRTSAASTIPGARQGLDPAVAFGLVRVFNYAMPDRALRGYRPITDPQARAALNVSPSDRLEDLVNGVIVRVERADLPALRAREAGYDLIPVPCLEWPEGRGAPLIAYALSCPHEPVDGVKRTDDTLTPHREYLERCLEGTRSISPEFADLFLRTSFIAGSGERLDQWSP